MGILFDITECEEHIEQLQKLIDDADEDDKEKLINRRKHWEMKIKRLGG